MVGREPRNYSLGGEIFWDLGTLRPWDLRDQSEVADKGVMVSSLSSLWSLWSLDLLGVSVFAVSWSLRSLRFCGLLGLFLKPKKMRSTEAERKKYRVFLDYSNLSLEAALPSNSTAFAGVTRTPLTRQFTKTTLSCLGSIL